MSPNVSSKNDSINELPADSSSLHLELSQLGFLTRYDNFKMATLAPWRRFILDKQSRNGFYDFIRTIQQESQVLGSHTDERQIVNADVERQLNDIFGKSCRIEICKPEQHDLLRHKDGTYSVAMLHRPEGIGNKSAAPMPTIYISELLLRTQDGHSQTRLHYQTALCEMVVGLILAREKLEKKPKTPSSKLIRLLCKHLLTPEKNADDYDNRCSVVMYSLSIRNFISFLKSPRTLTWIPSLDSIIRGGKLSGQDAVDAGYSVAKAWTTLGDHRKQLLMSSFDRLVDLSEKQARGQLIDRTVNISDRELREGAVTAKYIAQFIGLKNPVQTCEAALYSAFSVDTLKGLKRTFNFQISPRAKALVDALSILKETQFDISPKLEFDKANHTLDYQQGLLIQKCHELSQKVADDRKFHASDLLALYMASKTSEIGTLSDKVSQKKLASSLDKEGRFTLLPLMERLNVKLFNEVGYLLLRAFDPNLTARIKNRVSLQCGGLNLPQRKRFLSNMVDIARSIPDCKAEAREKTYYSVSDKYDESAAYLKNFAQEYQIRDIDKIINVRIPNEIIKLTGESNHFVHDHAEAITEELLKQAQNEINNHEKLVQLNESRPDLYKHIFSLLRNTDNLGIRLISPNPAQAIVTFSKKIAEAVEANNYDLVRVNRVSKPEGRRINLDGEWIIERIEVEVKPKQSDKSIFLELEVHSMTEGVNRNQKLGLGLFKYAFAHWVMKARRSVCRYNKIDEALFDVYTGIIPLQKDPEPKSEDFSHHYDILRKSLSKIGSFHKIGEELVCIPSWDTNPQIAIKATSAYRSHFKTEEIPDDKTSVFCQIAHNSNLRLKEFRQDLSEFTSDQVEDLLYDEAFLVIAKSRLLSADTKHLPNHLVFWFMRYYSNIFGLHPHEVCAALFDKSVVIDSKGVKKTTSQFVLEDFWSRAKNFFAVSEVRLSHPTEYISEMQIDANADLMGFDLSLFKLRREIANEMNMPVPPIKSMLDRSSSKHPNSQTISFGRHPDVSVEQHRIFLDTYTNRIKLNILPLNAKNTKKSTYSDRINFIALDTEFTLERLYQLAEDHGISIDHIRATTGEVIDNKTPVAKFMMRLSAILKERDLNEDSSENTKRVRARIANFIEELCKLEDSETARKIFSLTNLN